MFKMVELSNINLYSRNLPENKWCPILQWWAVATTNLSLLITLVERQPNAPRSLPLTTLAAAAPSLPDLTSQAVDWDFEKQEWIHWFQTMHSIPIEKVKDIKAGADTIFAAVRARAMDASHSAYIQWVANQLDNNYGRGLFAWTKEPKVPLLSSMHSNYYGIVSTPLQMAEHHKTEWASYWANPADDIRPVFRRMKDVLSMAKSGITPKLTPPGHH